MHNEAWLDVHVLSLLASSALKACRTVSAADPDSKVGCRRRERSANRGSTNGLNKAVTSNRHGFFRSPHVVVRGDVGVASVPGKRTTTVTGREISRVPGGNVAVVVELGVERGTEPDVAAHDAGLPMPDGCPCGTHAVSESRLGWRTENQICCASEVPLGRLVEAVHELAEASSELVGGQSVVCGAVNTLGYALEVVTEVPPRQKQTCAVVACPHLPCDFE